MADAKEKRRITFPLPETKDEKVLRTARAVKWRAPKAEVATGEMLPGEVYSVSVDFALYCVANKGARYVGADGKLTNEKAERIEISTRPGQPGWKGWEEHRGLAPDFGQEAPAAAPQSTEGNGSNGAAADNGASSGEGNGEGGGASAETTTKSSKKDRAQ